MEAVVVATTSAAAAAAAAGPAADDGAGPGALRQEEPDDGVRATDSLRSAPPLPRGAGARADTPAVQVLRPEPDPRHRGPVVRLGAAVQDGPSSSPHASFSLPLRGLAGIPRLARARLTGGFGGSRCQICQTTGWGGQPVRAHGGARDGDLASRLVPVTSAERIRVTFNAAVSDELPWHFVPQQREVRVLPGETALAFYTAENRGDKDIIGVATYSVTPAQSAPYFSKIQCFCFEEQRLNAGEAVDMPVFFYLDPDLLNDLNMRGVQTVTLNYTFFSMPAAAPASRAPSSPLADRDAEARYDDNGAFKPPAMT